MKSLWPIWLAFLVGLPASPARVGLAAQSIDGGRDTRLPRCAVTPYVGGARHSLVGTHLGVTPDRNHLFLGVHVTFNFARTDRWAVGYAPEVVPLLLISNNPKYRESAQGSGLPWLEQTGRGPVAGFAVSPIGFEGQLRMTSRWRAYGAGAAGVVWFSRDVPVGLTTRSRSAGGSSGRPRLRPHSAWDTSSITSRTPTPLRTTPASMALCFS